MFSLFHTGRSNGASTSKLQLPNADSAELMLAWRCDSVTMGIRAMSWDEWVELDREFPQYYKVCDYRIRTSGDRLLKVSDTQPGVVGSGHAAGEHPSWL